MVAKHENEINWKGNIIRKINKEKCAMGKCYGLEQLKLPDSA